MQVQRDCANTNTQQNGIKNVLEESSALRTRSVWSLDNQDMTRLVMSHHMRK